MAPSIILTNRFSVSKGINNFNWRQSMSKIILNHPVRIPESALTADTKNSMAPSIILQIGIVYPMKPSLKIFLRDLHAHAETFKADVRRTSTDLAKTEKEFKEMKWRVKPLIQSADQIRYCDWASRREARMKDRPRPISRPQVSPPSLLCIFALSISDSLSLGHRF
jgi:hypothetical protein